MSTEVKNSDQLLEQVKSQVKALNQAQSDKIDATIEKYNQEVQQYGKASNETRDMLKKSSDQMQELSEKNDELSSKLIDMQQKLTEGINVGTNKSVGAQVIDHEKFKKLQAKETAKILIQVKNTILTESGSPQEPDSHLVQPDYRALMAAPFRQLSVLDVIPTGETNSDIIHLPKETSHTNAAAETAQGGDAPESTINYGSQELTVRRIPHQIKVAEQALDDAPFIQSHINMRLLHGVRNRVQVQIITGNGTSPNLSGLTDSGNFTAFTPETGVTATDNLSIAKYATVGADYEATHIFMNPATFGAIERVKVGSGRNDYASTDGVALTYINGQPYIWGLPVVLCNDVTANKLMVLDVNNTGLWTNGNVDIQMSNSDDDNFTKDLVTIKAVGRFAFGVFRAEAVRYGDLTV